MDGRAVEAVIDCMYSGKLALLPRSVTGIIHAANLLQVGAVEKAAGEFFVSKLEPSTAADALGFAAERVAWGSTQRNCTRTAWGMRSSTSLR